MKILIFHSRVPGRYYPHQLPTQLSDEAGPCCYRLYHQLLELSHDCQVVAPSLIPKKPGERIKNDRRDASKLARSLRGIDKLTAMVLLAELGGISHFDSLKQLMAFLGLVPSAHTSGGRRRQRDNQDGR